MMKTTKKSDPTKQRKPTFEELLAADPTLALRIRRCPTSQEAERMRTKLGIRPEAKPALTEAKPEN